MLTDNAPKRSIREPVGPRSATFAAAAPRPAPAGARAPAAMAFANDRKPNGDPAELTLWGGSFRR